MVTVGWRHRFGGGEEIADQSGPGRGTGCGADDRRDWLSG